MWSRGRGDRSGQRPHSRGPFRAQATQGVNFLPGTLCAASATACLSPGSVNIMLTLCPVSANPAKGVPWLETRDFFTKPSFLRGQARPPERTVPSLPSGGFSEPTERGAVGWRVLDGEKQGGIFQGLSAQLRAESDATFSNSVPRPPAPGPPFLPRPSVRFSVFPL